MWIFFAAIDGSTFLEGTIFANMKKLEKICDN